jgi:hypothetical protein
MSDSDIEKGSRGLNEVADALEGIKVGIICLTPENLSAEWILYEAGALSKTLDAKTRVCTYLLANLHSQDVKPPLGMFQSTRAEKEDTRKLVHTINKHLDVTSVPDVGLNALFDKMWPELEAKLMALPKQPGVPPPKRSADEVLAEILELNRAMAPQILGLARDVELERRTREFLAAYQGSRRARPECCLKCSRRQPVRRGKSRKVGSLTESAWPNARDNRKQKLEGFARFSMRRRLVRKSKANLQRGHLTLTVI